jgi:hypothetical protein
MGISAVRLARKMYLAVVDVERENRDRKAAREGLSDRRHKKLPDLPVPAFGHSASVSEYLQLIHGREYEDVAGMFDVLSKAIRKADPSVVKEAWDIVLVQLVMDG